MTLNVERRHKRMAWIVAVLAACVPVPARAADTDNTALVETNLVDKSDSYAAVERLAEAMLLIEKNYVEEKTVEELMSGALRGMLHSLDPHSSFLEPRALEGMKDDTEGRYGGIGIYVDVKEGAVTVIAPIEDTPGFHAGMKGGDRILEIDGDSTDGIDVDEAVKRLRGEPGSKVTMSVLSPGDKEPRDITLVREAINIPSVRGARIIEDGIGYVRLTQFSMTSAHSLEEAISSLRTQGLTALILDLRSNHGGLLQSAIDVAQIFLKRGALIVTTRTRDGIVSPARALGGHHLLDVPVAVLVNAETASASEIVAGAMQDHSRAVLVGDTTYGKGSVQSIIRLKTNNDSALRLTTAYYYTPAGRKIHNEGIEPDVKVYVPPEEWHRVRVRQVHLEHPEHYTDEERIKFAGVEDRQLEEAVRLLKAIRIFKAGLQE